MPWHPIPSQAFPTSIQYSGRCFDITQHRHHFRALGIIRAILGHDSLSLQQGLPVPPSSPCMQKSIAEVIEKDDQCWFIIFSPALMEHFAPEMMSGVITTVRILTQFFWMGRWGGGKKLRVCSNGCKLCSNNVSSSCTRQARTQFILDFNAYAFFLSLLTCFNIWSTSAVALACWRSRSDQAGYFTAPAKCATHKDRRRPWIVDHCDEKFTIAKRFHLGFLCYLLVKMGLIQNKISWPLQQRYKKRDNRMNTNQYSHQSESSITIWLLSASTVMR